MLRTLVQAMRRSVRQTLLAARAARKQRRLPVTRAAALREMRPGRDRLSVRVLGILDDHPDGVQVQEIGNELGIDWRGLPPTLRGLVASGLADQIDQDFYPAGKASRTC